MSIYEVNGQRVRMLERMARSTVDGFFISGVTNTQERYSAARLPYRKGAPAAGLVPLRSEAV